MCGGGGRRSLEPLRPLILLPFLFSLIWRPSSSILDGYNDEIDDLALLARLLASHRPCLLAYILGLDTLVLRRTLRRGLARHPINSFNERRAGRFGFLIEKTREEGETFNLQVLQLTRGMRALKPSLFPRAYTVQ
jgi:hypothetical protein